MKTIIKYRRALLLVLTVFLIQGCSQEEIVKMPAGVDGVITRTSLTPSGNITNTENGYIVDGTLTLDTEASGPVVFNDANLSVEFNSDGTLGSVSGTAEIPPTSNYFEFANPIQADIGFFTGKFLNENRDFEIELVDERTYFVFAISVNFELKLGVNDDPDAHKPLSISPFGGHITYIADYTDPMFFFSIGGDALGGGDDSDGDSDGGGDTDGTNGGDGNNDDGSDSHTKLAGVSFGASWGANFIFEPTNPIPGEVITFESSLVFGGTVSFFTMLSASGMYYQNTEFDVNADFDEPMESDFGLGYRAGINGTLDLDLEIVPFVSFGFPIGSGSAAVVAEVNTDGEHIAKAFINGLVEPDLSWWPNFIPVTPSGNLNAYGFVEQTGNFDIGLSGELKLDTPTGEQSIGGAMQATPQAFTMEGQVTIDDETWKANATFTKEETKVIATPPTNFTDGIADTVTSQIDAAIETTEQALADLEAANEQHDLELSLRGLRVALPDIIDRANTEITTAVNNAVSAAESQASSVASDQGAALCGTNASAVVNNKVAKYKNALNRLKNAVNDQNDNDQTRIELEAALRQLASMDKISENFTVTITYGNKAVGVVGKCKLWKKTTTRSRSVNRTIINADQKAQLLEAADNVKYIEEADGIRFDAQVIVDRLPTVEELEDLKDHVEACVAELSEGLEQSGFIFNHDTKEFTPFIVINGEEKEVSTFNIFSSEEMIDRARVNTTDCDPDDVLKQLQLEAKQRRK